VADEQQSGAVSYVQGLWPQLQQRESELRVPGVRIPAVLAASADHMGEGISNLQHALSHVLADAKHAALFGNGPLCWEAPCLTQAGTA